MSNTINDPPPSYAIRENDEARISQCADNVLALDKLYQDLTLAVLRAVQDPTAEKLAKDVQRVGQIITVHFPSLKLINAGFLWLPSKRSEDFDGFRVLCSKCLHSSFDN